MKPDDDASLICIVNMGTGRLIFPRVRGMSDALYRTRLRWENGRGAARLDGVSVALKGAPVICGRSVDHVDYTPECQCFEIRRAPSDAVCEMTAEEIADAAALLRALCQQEAKP